MPEKKLSAPMARKLADAHERRTGAEDMLADARARAQAAEIALTDAVKVRCPVELEKWETAKGRVERETAWLEKMQREADEVLARYLDRLPVGVIRVAGLLIERTQKTAQRSFRIAQFLDAGGRITKAMEPHYSPGKVTDSFTVTKAPES